MIPKGELTAPELGRVWINSGELTLGGLRGRVVLIDFWDYTCINCLRTLPYLVEWDRRYRDKGLTIIGVHAPEFSFARRGELVRKAVEEFGISYPVVLDNDYQIWRIFANRYWPAKYLIDKDGFVRLVHFGEGAYPETEAAIQELLREINPGAELPPLMPPVRESDRPGTVCYPATPELYLGYHRGRIGNPGGFQKETAAEYKLPKEAPSDVISLGGRWLAGPEFLESAPRDGNQPARLVLPYLAKEVNLVMASRGDELSLRVAQGGAPVARADAGADIEFTAEGEGVVMVREPKMYRLISNAVFGPRRLELETTRTGLGLYAFTFVSCPAE